MAKEFNLRLVFQAIDKVTAPARRIGEALSEIVRRAKLDRLMAELDRARARMARFMEAGKKLRDIGGGMFARITAPFALLGGFSVTAYAKMEQLQVAFESMLGSADAAKKMVGDLASFAAKTPFQLEGIGASAKQLLAFGVIQDKVIPTLKLLGDISAGANVPLEEMTAIYGKSMAKGKVMTEELLQMSDRGIPIIKTLEKGLGKTGEEIFKLASEGKISFSILEKALASMTAEGGIFANQMDKQSQTMAGIFSTLKDNIFNAASIIGDVLNENLNIKQNMIALIEWIQEATERFKQFAAEHPGLLKFGLIVAGIAAAAGPLLIVLGMMSSGFGLVAAGATVLTPLIVGLIAPISNFILALRAGYSAMAALNLVMAANPIGLVILAVAALAAAAYLLYDNWDTVVGFFTGIFDQIVAAFDEGLLQGVMKVLSLFSPAGWVMAAIDAVFELFGQKPLSQLAADWAGGFADGFGQKWTAVTGWIKKQITALIDWMPDWVKDKLGIGDFGSASSGAPDDGSSLPGAVPSALSGGSETRVGGSLTVQFKNPPPGMSVERLKSDNPDVPISYDAGYAMGNS